MLIGVVVLLLGALFVFAQNSLWMQRALMERAVKTRILFGFVQVVTRMELSYQLRLPASVVAFFAHLGYIEILDLSALFGSMRCLVNHTYIERVYAQTCSAAVLLLATGLLSVRASSPATRASASNAMLLLSFMMYPSMVTTLFNVFGCTKYEDGRSYLDVDRSIDCGSAQYRRVEIFAACVAPVFTAGIPLAYLLLLRRQRDLLAPPVPVNTLLGPVAFSELRRRGTRSIQHLAFLWRGYVPQMWWFEVFEMVRKFLLTAPILLGYVMTDAARPRSCTAC